MIISFRNKDTERFFEGKEVRKFRAVDRVMAYKRFDYLHTAQSLSDIPPLKSFHLHRLRGDRKGQWAISLNGPWRICFEFKNGNAYNVELVDYHQ
jgi:proteic killer suppression protein